MRDGGHSWRKALLAGLVVALVPVLGLNVLLAVNFVTASQRDADGVAAEALGFVEERLDNASTALSIRRGVASLMSPPGNRIPRPAGRGLL
ncbi:EAL domain-containing protein, partial [Hansschlegelia beijingensis]